MARKYVRRAPYQRIKPHNTVTETQIRLLLQLHAEQTSIAEIARTLGLSRMHVYRLLDRYCPKQ